MRLGINKTVFPKHSKRSPGFTLLELMISLTILAVIVVMVFGALRIGIRAWEKGERDVEEQQRKRIVFDLMKHQISSASATGKIEKQDEAPYFMKGNAISLEFQSDTPIFPGNTGLVHVFYKIAEDEEDGKKSLLFSELEAFSENIGEKKEGEPEKDFHILVSGARDMHFEYLSKGEKQEEPEWVEEWDETKKNALPLAVGVSFRAQENSIPLRVIARIEQEKE